MSIAHPLLQAPMMGVCRNPLLEPGDIVLEPVAIGASLAAAISCSAVREPRGSAFTEPRTVCKPGVPARSSNSVTS